MNTSSPRFPSLKESYREFGFSSQESFYQAFKQKRLPCECLIKVSARRVVVDADRLAEWYRSRANAAI